MPLADRRSRQRGIRVLWRQAGRGLSVLRLSRAHRLSAGGGSAARPAPPTRIGVSSNQRGYARGLALRTSAEPVVEGVTGAAHGADRVRSPPAIQSLAQAPDVHVNGALIDIDVAAPNAVEQLLAREHAAGALHQKFEQAELGGSEWNLAAAARDPFLLPVSSMSPATRTSATRSGLTRRNSARMRASSSGTENGLTI